jgi:hypothetical protein
MKALRHLNKYFLKYWKKLLIGLLITASARIFSLVMPSYINKSIQTIERFFNEEITKEAYKRPRMNAASNRQREAEDFRNDMEIRCYEAVE